MSETTASNFINANVRVGDICILKSQFTVGVPLMTVARTDGENLVVSWFDGDNMYHEEIVNKKALFKYTGQTLQ